jgi:hypothetical protein
LLREIKCDHVWPEHIKYAMDDVRNFKCLIQRSSGRSEEIIFPVTDTEQLFQLKDALK